MLRWKLLRLRGKRLVVSSSLAFGTKNPSGNTVPVRVRSGAPNMDTKYSGEMQAQRRLRGRFDSYSVQLK